MGYKPYILIVTATATVKVEASNSGYLMSSTEATWDAAHDAVEAASVSNNDNIFIYRGRTAAPTYFIGRSGCIFPVPSGFTVVSASVFLYGIQAYLDEGADAIVLVDGSDLADTLVIADYLDLLDEVTSYGSLISAAFLAEGWNELALTASGLAALQTAISLGVNFRVGVRLDKDINDIAPTLDHYDEVIFYGSNALTSIPTLFATIID